jgi:hypothetical protein
LGFGGYNGDVMDIRKIILETLLDESREERQSSAFSKWCEKTQRPTIENILKNGEDMKHFYSDYVGHYGEEPDGEELGDYVENFMMEQCGTLENDWLTYRNQAKSNDIFSYKDIFELEPALKDAKEKSFTKKLKTAKQGEDYDKIYEDEDLMVIVPLTHVGSCKYSQGAKWCTASKEAPQYFERYTKMGTLYRIIQKGDYGNRVFPFKMENPQLDEDDLSKVSVYITNEGNYYVSDSSNTGIDKNFLSLFPKAKEAIEKHQKSL